METESAFDDVDVDDDAHVEDEVDVDMELAAWETGLDVDMAVAPWVSQAAYASAENLGLSSDEDVSEDASEVLALSEALFGPQTDGELYIQPIFYCPTDVDPRRR